MSEAMVFLLRVTLLQGDADLPAVQAAAAEAPGGGGAVAQQLLAAHVHLQREARAPAQDDPALQALRERVVEAGWRLLWFMHMLWLERDRGLG